MAKPPTPSPSLLAGLLQLLEATGPWRVNIEDLSGVTYDIPELDVPQRFRVHGCDTCLAAQSTRAGHNRCIRNKKALNRLVARRQAGVTGYCHRGLTEVVEPLMVEGRCLAVFYLGQVVASATESAARARRESRHRRYGAPSAPDPGASAIAAAPRVSDSQLSQARAHLQTVVQTCRQLIAGSGLPMQSYRIRTAANLVHPTEPLPALLQNAVRLLMQRYAASIRLADIAAELGCHPDHLSRLFQRHFERGFVAYLRELRMVHARRLLRQHRHTISEIAYRVGYSDVSHFGRDFRRVARRSPSHYRADPPDDSERLLLPPARPDANPPR